jgi:hypothetical protein
LAQEPCALVPLSHAEIELLRQPATPPKLPRKPKLILDAQHGLGNRLRALGSAAAIAKATGRELVLLWEPDIHCQCSITDLFEYPHSLVQRREDLDLEAADRATYMEIEPGACKDAPLVLREGKDFYIRSAYVLNHPASTWDTENAFLRALRPVAEVQALVDTAEAHGRLGVHIRFEGAQGTDTNAYDSAQNWLPEGHRELISWREKSHPDRFMGRIDQLTRENPDLKIFLATDRPEIYDTLRARYADRLSFLRRHVYDRSRDQLRYALADALLLSRCHHLLGSTWSSFTEMARRFSTTIQRVEMSGTDF